MNSGRSARQLCAGQQRCIAHTLLLIVLSHYVVAACTVQPTVLHWPPLTTRDRAQTLWTEFTEFTQTHGKTYRPDEVLKRFKIFNDTDDFTTDHNTNHADAAGCTVGINQSADMTRAEWNRQYFGLDARISRDFSTKKALETNDLPTDIDWMAK